ncbi:hypothetical protein EYF80_053811 [Liparis tanakae]|uniref:Uncharacterized protein n=1 Tax=Liparis tanakae TaxID=230148 RepID=A0A4Z2F4F2_9TELE|nr:hypothetical protein EYF80_053811 [Liparis tanakae]
MVGLNLCTLIKSSAGGTREDGYSQDNRLKAVRCSGRRLRPLPSSGSSTGLIDRCPTCQQVCGDFLSRMNCVSGDGSSSYLSKGTLSMTIGSESRQEKRTWGWAERGG